MAGTADQEGITTTVANEYAARDMQFLYDSRPHTPCFMVNGDNVQPLFTPTEFYEEIKARIRAAKKSVTLVALYVGHTENELIQTLADALERNPELEVTLVFDALRGTRDSGKGSSASLLLPLVKAYPERVRVSMYHTPDLNGVLKRVMPPRFNEGIGLQHMKIYAFDDALILSGANLSQDYFTNRQDRYMLIQDKELTSYFTSLVSTVRSFSYRLKPSSSMQYALELEPHVPDPVKDCKQFRRYAYQRVRSFLKTWSSHRMSPLEGSRDTALFPLIQMGPLGIRQDERVTLSMLNRSLHRGRTDQGLAHMFITSGYFNFEEQYSQTIVSASTSNVTLIAAAPEANGFFKSKGISKYVPDVYTLIEKRFFETARKLGNESRVKIEEYKRDQWTYHAKGLWIYPPQSRVPVVSTIGSPNFGYRSLVRDLEAQLFVVTKNPSLQEKLDKELASLRQYTTMVTDATFQAPDRAVANWVKGASRVIRSMF
ncbi:CDP-diacylglycerol--glycerol-3-phosphate 3-phosphatidyltransferase [Actinomortierella ambigua]|nr:CDP-diacylglycerol--glycerol-3-phosphate 3-phosphatidyltransferase [Actinomortierella ambigua]